MASAEARAGYAVNRCFTRDFSMSPSDYQSPVSKKLESDFIHSDDSIDSDMKWWLHVKTNLGSDANYSWESKFDAFNVDIGSDQSVKNLDSLSCVGSVTNTIALEQQWNVYPKCIQKINDTKTAKIEAALNNDLHLAPRKKIEGEFWFSDDVSSVLVSKQCKSTSSDLESYWLRGEKTRPWWDTTGKDDLGYLVAKKSRDNDNDKNVVSSLSRKSESCSSEANGCQSTTLTSGYSFQDSNRTFR